jgi:hypothetical protein
LPGVGKGVGAGDGVGEGCGDGRGGTGDGDGGCGLGKVGPGPGLGGSPFISMVANGFPAHNPASTTLNKNLMISTLVVVDLITFTLVSLLANSLTTRGLLTFD